jgi:hypothetical protein
MRSFSSFQDSVWDCWPDQEPAGGILFMALGMSRGLQEAGASVFRCTGGG